MQIYCPDWQYERLLGYEKEKDMEKMSKSSGVAKKLSDDLQHLFKVEKIYRRPRLSVDDVAEKLGISSNRLSTMLNQEYQKPFSDFVNAYRIVEAREILKGQDEGGKYAHYTVQAIAESGGFQECIFVLCGFQEDNWCNAGGV